MAKDVISFVRQKDFRLLKELGQGGLGKTVLLLDSEMAEQFVCKKYAPYDPAIQDEYYDYFKNEIKVMYQVNHPNIVRIFNYYLYPEFKTGYILMEYIDGSQIGEFLQSNPSRFDYVFQQTIEAFQYLEANTILHRDIRKENIMVSVDGTVKIIDFGFGKRIFGEEDKGKSISLNWWCEKPRDFESNIYDSTTEVYFVGKLFEYILADGFDQPFEYQFSYRHIFEKMVRINPTERIRSFADVKSALLEQTVSFDELFSWEERQTYKNFADGLLKSIASFDEGSKYQSDMARIITNLEQLYKENVLEEEVQNTNILVRAFVSGSFQFYNKPVLSTYALRDMVKILKTAGTEKREIFLLNIQNRLNRVARTQPEEKDDIPF